MSDLAQYAVRGPAFGGISGVMCGLLGYTNYVNSLVKSE